MASPGELVKAIAHMLGLPEPTVTQHDRNLAMAGLRTMGGRGRSAAKVTALDAARILAAILGSDQVKDSVATVNRLSDTRTVSGFKGDKGWGQIPGTAMSNLADDHSFIDALTALIEIAADHHQLHKLIVSHQPTSIVHKTYRGIVIEVGVPSGNSKIITQGQKGLLVRYSLHPEKFDFELQSEDIDVLDEKYGYSGKGELKQVRTVTGWTLHNIACVLTGTQPDESEML